MDLLGRVGYGGNDLGSGLLDLLQQQAKGTGQSAFDWGRAFGTRGTPDTPGGNVSGDDYRGVNTGYPWGTYIPPGYVYDGNGNLVYIGEGPE